MATSNSRHPITTAAAAAATSQHKTLLIGISGPSSSGKTTLARLLRDIFTHDSLPPPPLPPPTQSQSASPTPQPPQETPKQRFSKTSLKIIHQDDFYLTDTLIPLITTDADCPSGLGVRELQDWDCLGSLDLALFERVIGGVKERGSLGGEGEEGEGGERGWVSKEDKNDVGESGVAVEEVRELRGRLGDWLSRLLPRGDEKEGGEEGEEGQAPELRIFILDGFLLYTSPFDSESKSLQQLRRITSHLSLKLFLPTSRSQTLARRTNRSGYVTLEGFWADPPGYVEDVVWPGYLRDHAWMFKSPLDSIDNKGGEGGQGVKTGRFDPESDPEIDIQKALEGGVQVAPGRGTCGMRELVEWAVEKVKGAVEDMP